MRAGVALGSNLGNRLANLQSARQAISAIRGVTPPVIASAIYETEPVGCEPGAQNFLNSVIEFSYDGTSVELFDKLRQVEVALGRPANHLRNVSRTIDIDLLYLGDTTMNTDQLTLPHPRISGRAFVLRPLADIQSDLVLPGQTKTVGELLASAAQSAKVVRTGLEWEAR